MKKLKDNSIVYRFNDSLINEIDLDIESPIRLKNFFEVYHLLHFEIDGNIQKRIDESINRKYIKN